MTGLYTNFGMSGLLSVKKKTYEIGLLKLKTLSGKLL